MIRLASFFGICVVCMAFLLSGTLSGAEEQASQAKTEKPTFVDLDGDGFDDNAAVGENKDDTKAAKLTAADTTSFNSNFFDLGSVMPSRAQVFLDNSSEFATIKQRIVCGLSTRGGFASSGDFGSGGLGAGVVLGGVCVGGVCH